MCLVYFNFELFYYPVFYCQRRDLPGAGLAGGMAALARRVQSLVLAAHHNNRPYLTDAKLRVASLLCFKAIANSFHQL
jgi:hypothetical protein